MFNDKKKSYDLLLMLLQVLGSGSDAFTVLRRLCFDHKAEEFLATASVIVLVSWIQFSSSMFYR